MLTHQKFIKKSIKSPDETREFLHGSGSVKVMNLGDEVFGYFEFKPGWRWSKDVQPKVGGDSCQVTHNIFVMSGRMAVKMDDGTEIQIGPGDATFIAPGHDAWIVGNEPCICLDVTGARSYAT